MRAKLALAFAVVLTALAILLAASLAAAPL